MNIKHWFIGSVEDIADPLQIGRIKVRCFSYHTEDTSELPTRDLPWSQCVLPINTSSTAGVGSSPTGMVVGDWVFGFFRDGEDKQDSVVIGLWTSPGDTPADSTNYGQGDSSTGQNFAGNMIGGISGGPGIYPTSWEESAPPTPIPGSISNMLSTLRGEVGVRETSKNQGPGIAKYWPSTSYGSSGYSNREPWCAAFVSWVVESSGIITDNLPNTASAYGLIDWARRNSQVKLTMQPRSVKEGDIVVFSFSHTGICTEASNGSTFKSIEGNTNAAGSREGNAVTEKTRKLSLLKAGISFNTETLA